MTACPTEFILLSQYSPWSALRLTGDLGYQHEDEWLQMEKCILTAAIVENLSRRFTPIECASNPYFCALFAALRPNSKVQMMCKIETNRSPPTISKR